MLHWNDSFNQVILDKDAKASLISETMSFSTDSNDKIR